MYFTVPPSLRMIDIPYRCVYRTFYYNLTTYYGSYVRIRIVAWRTYRSGGTKIDKKEQRSQVKQKQQKMKKK